MNRKAKEGDFCIIWTHAYSSLEGTADLSSLKQAFPLEDPLIQFANFVYHTTRL